MIIIFLWIFLKNTLSENNAALNELCKVEFKNFNLHKKYLKLLTNVSSHLEGLHLPEKRKKKQKSME